MMLQEYAREHVVTCLIPAFFILPMQTYPDFSDLGTVGGSIKNAWEYHLAKLQEGEG